MGALLRSCRIRRTFARVRGVCDRGGQRAQLEDSEYVVSDVIGDAGLEQWDLLAKRAPFFLDRAYLGVLADAGPRNLRHRYVLVRRRGTPVAAVAAQVLDISPSALVTARLGLPEAERRRLMQRAGMALSYAAVRALSGRLVVCGNFLSTGPHGAVWDPGETPESIWPAIIEALNRIAAVEDTDYLMIKDIPSAWASGADVFRRHGFHPLETEPDMVLELADQWRCYEDYINALNAKYRKATHGIFEMVEAAGCVMETWQDLRGDVERLHALYGQVEKRARINFAAFPPEYLPALAQAAGPERFRCHVVRHGDRFLGFLVTLRDGETAVAHCVGLDYAANAELPVYFRLLHAAVADAFEWGCRRVEFGRTALEPKARLGARPVPLVCWIRNGRGFRNFVTGVVTRVTPHAQPPRRHPFKKA